MSRQGIEGPLRGGGGGSVNGDAVPRSPYRGGELSMSSSVAAPSSATQQPVGGDGGFDLGNTRLPKLHWCCYRGDTLGVLNCITEGHSLQDTISLKNQHNKLVCGITPLFLAAQRGHLDCARLLVENGANPLMPCYIQGSAELCTPREVANLNLHFKVARYLKRAARQRRREDSVLADDDDDTLSVASGVSSVRSIARFRPASRIGSRSQLASAGISQGAPGGQVNQAAVFMEQIDLATFDPDSGNQKRSSGSGGIFGCCFSPPETQSASAQDPRQQQPRPLANGVSASTAYNGNAMNLNGSTNANASSYPTVSAASNGASAAQQRPANMVAPPSPSPLPENGLGFTSAIAAAATGTRQSRDLGRGGGQELQQNGAPVNKNKQIDRFLKDLDLSEWKPER